MTALSAQDVLSAAAFVLALLALALHFIPPSEKKRIQEAIEPREEPEPEHPFFGPTPPAEPPTKRPEPLRMRRPR